jgi:hypothetical protein
MSALQTQITSAEEIADPLAQKPEPPDRLFYAIGILLDAEDFKAEQLYHRGRLSRTLAYLHGGGTVAGLKVEWKKPLESGESEEFKSGREEEIVVHPGLAIDRLGRVIEVPVSSCIRLKRWYEKQPAAELVKAFHPAKAGDPANVVVVDVFIRFFICERGKTPAFATGPFDALDAVQPSRMREFYKIELVAREHDNPDLLKSGLTDLSALTPAARRAQLHKEILDGWREGTEEAQGQWKKNGGLAPLSEHESNQDPTSVFLARLKLPADPPPAVGERPVREATEEVSVDNESRRFVYTANSLARWIGI